MFNNDPGQKRIDSQLTMGEHFVMLLFLLVAVCVGFFIFKAYVLEPIMNPAGPEKTQQSTPAKS